MSYSPNEIEVFRFCFQLISEGCKSSFEAERYLRVKFWWITHLDAERFVKRFWRERSKIEEVLGQYISTNDIQNDNSLSQISGATGDPCCETS